MGRPKPNKPRRERPKPQDETEGYWIHSDVDPVTGNYGLSMSIDGDLAWSFTPDEGWQYVKMVATQLSRVTHDAAVLKQMLATGIKPHFAAQVLARDIRPDRRPVDQVGPLRIEPGVTIEGKPFLRLFHDESEQPIGQWEVDDARHHLLGMIETIETIELDDRLRRVMLNVINLDDATARAFVHLLKDHRA